MGVGGTLLHMLRRHMILTALLLLFVGCGEDGSGDEEGPAGDSEPAAEATANEADEEAAEPPPPEATGPESRTGMVGDSCDPFQKKKTCGHWDGPLRAEHMTFQGLIRSPKDIYFRDGRSLKGYVRRPGRVQTYNLGESTFNDSEYFFDRRRLRLHRLFRTGMSSRECFQATWGIQKVFGKPLVDKRGEKMWRLEWIEVRWRDTALDGSNPETPRCIVEYRDREWFSGR